MSAGRAVSSTSGRRPFIAIQTPPGASKGRVRRTKSGNEAKARAVIRSNDGPSSVSTRACSACKLGRASSPATWRMKAAFLPTVSTQLTSHCGSATANTAPGRPPPLPTSRMRGADFSCSRVARPASSGVEPGDPPPSVRRSGAITARQSAMCCTRICAGSRSAVRLYAAFHLRSNAR